MWDLSRHEKIEMEALDGLNSQRILERVIFCGGTMLRLVHELNRYSVDLDFWFLEQAEREELYAKTKEFLSRTFMLKKSRHTETSIVFEFAVPKYPRALKLEMRYYDKKIGYENKIAFSKHSAIQVMVKAATLDEMMKAKIDTFLDRIEIRDVFDIEFLAKKGIAIDAPKQKIAKMLALIAKFKPADYKVSLGSLLEFKEREYYKSAKFSYLVNRLENLIGDK